MRILVPECGGPAGVSSIRAIQKINKTKDVKISGYDVDANCAMSEWVDDFFISPAAKDHNFESFLAEKVQNSDLLVPSGGNDLLAISKIKDKFPKALRFFSEISTIESCVDKSKTFSIFKDFVFIPRTENFRFADVVFAKPKDGKGSLGCTILNSDAITPATENMIYQEYLPGREITVDALFDTQGSLRVCVPRERVKTRGGISTCARFLKSDFYRKSIVEMSKVMKFIGPICFQFKEDLDGNPKLMEINPRMAGGYGMTLAIGINFIEMMIKDDYKHENEIIDFDREIIVSRIFEEVIIAR